MKSPFCTVATSESGELASGISLNIETTRCPRCQTLVPVRVERRGSHAWGFIQPHIPDFYQFIENTGTRQVFAFGAGGDPTTVNTKVVTAGEMKPADLLAAVDRLYRNHLDHHDYVVWRVAFVAQHEL